VTATLQASGAVTVANVPSYRHAADVAVDVAGYGTVVGDVAWGGNWFFLVKGHQQRLSLDRLEPLTEFTWAIREALTAQGITGAAGAIVDHIEVFAPSEIAGVDSKNFVLCPGKAYDRSPCGTGTSAKLACLYADGKLSEGQIWRQESIVGSVFEGQISLTEPAGHVLPRITGTAYVNADAHLILSEDDPFQWGIRR
jgi:4-hydroxyproline epimerase